MPDIETRADIDALMRVFYGKAIGDAAIGYLFTEVTRLDLERHLPVIGDFWETTLFGTQAYLRHKRNPLQLHLDLHGKSPLEPAHFARWLELFDESVDSLFEGKRATFAKQRARGIAFRFMAAMPPRAESPG